MRVEDGEDGEDEEEDEDDEEDAELPKSPIPSSPCRANFSKCHSGQKSVGFELNSRKSVNIDQCCGCKSTTCRF